MKKNFSGKVFLLALAAIPLLGCSLALSIADTPEFVKVPLAAVVNHPMDNLVSPLSGTREFKGVPFSFLSGEHAVLHTQHHFLPSYPESVRLTVDIRRPVRVYVLVNGGYVYASLKGKIAGEITLTFADGSQVYRSLVVGENLREHWGYMDGPTPGAGAYAAVTDLAETGEWVNVYAEEQWRVGGSARAYIDMVTIEVPASMQKSALTSIEVADILLDPGLIVYAITVETRG